MKALCLLREFAFCLFNGTGSDTMKACDPVIYPACLFAVHLELLVKNCVKHFKVASIKF